MTPELPGIRLVRLLGAGAMGKVFEAVQLGTSRKVAVKILSEDLARNENYVQRFIREARAMARLNHPNIVAAFDAGSQGDHHYLVMEYVEGSTLEGLIKSKKKLPESLCVRVALQAAKALDHAASNNLVHRDIKPANLMLSKDGTVKLCDLGLAKPAEVEGILGLTTAGTVLGTPLYMSPEQAQGGSTDFYSDMYSLGATVYHMATGQPPFAAPTLRGLINQHINAPVPHPKKFNPTLSTGFSAVLIKMLEKRPSDRYASHAEVAKEFERLAAGKSVLAALQTHRQMRSAAPRSGTRALAVVIGLLVACIAGLAWIILAGSPSARPRREEPASSSRPTAQPKPEASERPAPTPTPPPADSSKHAKALNLLAEADLLFEERNYAKAAERLIRLQQEFGGLPPVQARVEEISRKLGKCRVEMGLVDAAFEEAKGLAQRGDWESARAKLRSLESKGVDSERVPPGELRDLISVCDQELACGQDLQRLRRLVTENSWREAAALLDQLSGSHSATRSYRDAKGEVEALRVRCRREVQAQDLLFRIRGLITGEAWADAQAALIELEGLGDSDTFRSAAREIDSTKQKVQVELRRSEQKRIHEAWDRSMELVTQEKWADGQAGLNGFRESFGATEIFKARESEWKAALDRCEKGLLKAKEAHARTLWNTALDDMKKARYPQAKEGLSKLLVDFGDTPYVKTIRKRIEKELADCDRLAGGASSPADLSKLVQIDRLKAPTGVATAVAVSADGKTLAIAGDDLAIKIFDADSGRLLRTLQGHTGEIRALSFASDGKTLASGGKDRLVKAWTVATGRESLSLAAHDDDINSISFTPNGASFASSSDDGTIKLWNASSGKPLHVFTGHNKAVEWIRFSPDGQVLASTGKDDTLRLWSVSAKKEIRILVEHSKHIRTLTFRADGKVLAWGDEGGAVQLWDLTTEKHVRTLSQHTADIRSLVFSSDGKVLASAGEDNQVVLWDPETGRAIRTLPGHTGRTAFVAFGPNGKCLITAAPDETGVRFWGQPE